jgi:hypothetical protein
MSEQAAGTTAEPESKRVTTALVTGSAADAPYRVDVKAGSRTAITLRPYPERKEWPLEAVRVRLGYGTRTGTRTATNGVGARITRRVALAEALDEAPRARLPNICDRTPVTLAVRSVRRFPAARQAGVCRQTPGAGVAIETTEDHA